MRAVAMVLAAVLLAATVAFATTYDSRHPSLQWVGATPEEDNEEVDATPGIFLVDYAPTDAAEMGTGPVWLQMTGFVLENRTKKAFSAVRITVGYYWHGTTRLLAQDTATVRNVRAGARIFVYTDGFDVRPLTRTIGMNNPTPDIRIVVRGKP